MKNILLLAALVVSAVPVKAADDIEFQKKQAYYYGFIWGSGATLCGAIVDNKITKEYARYFLPALVKEIAKYPESEDIIPKLNEAQNAVMKSDACKGVFQ